TTTLHFPGVWAIGWQHFQRYVTNELAVQTIFHLSCGHLGTFDLAGERGGIDTDGHRNRRLVNGDLWQWFRIVGIGEGIADHDVFDTGYSHDFAWASRFCR